MLALDVNGDVGGANAPHAYIPDPISSYITPQLQPLFSKF